MGLVLLAESHIMVHMDIETARAFIDIFSCKNFQIGPAIQQVEKGLKVRICQQRALERGLEYVVPARQGNAFGEPQHDAR